MAEFNPFGQLMEVQRYKQNLAMKQDQIARDNAFRMSQAHQQARFQQNAMAQAGRESEAAQRRQMDLEMTLGNQPADQRQEALISRGFLKEAGQVQKALGKPASEASPYSTPIKTSKGWVSYNNRTGTYQPIKMEGGGPALPIAADTELAGKKTGAIKEAERVAKLKATKPKAEASLKAFERSSDNIMKTIDEAIAGVSGKTAGFFGQKTAGIAGTDAFTLAEQLKTIKSSDAFGFLQEMRNNSPTGGAVGQLSDRELEVMGLIKASLNQGLDPIQLKKNLNRIKKLTTEIRKDARTAYTKDFLSQTDKKLPPDTGLMSGRSTGSTALKSKYGLE